MKKNARIIPLGIALMLTAMSCSKSNESSKIQEQNANEFRSSIKQHRYRLVDFYADKPIDYIEDDNEVKQETDLKPYIKAYLVDDENLFDSTGTLKIYQNSLKFPGDNSPVITRNFNVSFDNSNVLFDFVDYNYIPVKYKLANSTPTSFSIYLDWHTGAKVYSVFNRID